MTNSPPARHPRYQKLRLLGQNPAGGRATYLVRDNTTQQLVAITLFQIAKTTFHWLGLKNHAQEIVVLRRLNHSGIPRYINFFETKTELGMVQEYKETQPLSQLQQLNPEQIKHITVQILEILVYLQNHSPVIIHRNLTPENIWVDEQFRVYLVDFSFALIGNREILPSNINTIKTEFFAPEQIYNRQLTEATDLYSLGVTLVSAISQTSSDRIHTLINSSGLLVFQHLFPHQLSLGFFDWLSKLVNPSYIERYPNAALALEAFQSININRLPQVKFNPTHLILKATEFGETITQSITVTNPVPDTHLEATWTVAPHVNDRHQSNNSHAWISVEPAFLQSNKTSCLITINTQKLLAAQTYERQLVLQGNCSPETLTVTVETAPLVTNKLPLTSLSILFIVALIAGLSISLLTASSGIWGDIAFKGAILGLIIGNLGGVLMSFNAIPLVATQFSVQFFSRLFLLMLLLFGFLSALGAVVIGTMLGFFLGLMVGCTTGYILRNNFGASRASGVISMIFAIRSQAGLISLLMAGFGIILGMLFKTGFHPLAFLSLLVTGVPLGYESYRLYSQQNQQIINYQKSQSFLIKP